MLEHDKDFDISAFSESADEVGGDYYDTLRTSDNHVSLIIADVSGKGTTAAFHMSQMKTTCRRFSKLRMPLGSSRISTWPRRFAPT